MDNFLTAHAALIVSIFQVVVIGLALPIANKFVEAKLGAARGAQVETAVKAGLQTAIVAATTGQNTAETIHAVLNDPNVRNNVIDVAHQYVTDAIPGVIGKLGIDDNLKAIINARVEDAVAALAQKYTVANAAIATAVQTDSKIAEAPHVVSPAVKAV